MGGGRSIRSRGSHILRLLLLVVVVVVMVVLVLGILNMRLGRLWLWDGSHGSSSAGVLVMFRHCQDQVFFLVLFLGAESKWRGRESPAKKGIKRERKKRWKRWKTDRQDDASQMPVRGERGQSNMYDPEKRQRTWRVPRRKSQEELQ